LIKASNKMVICKIIMKGVIKHSLHTLAVIINPLFLFLYVVIGMWLTNTGFNDGKGGYLFLSQFVWTLLIPLIFIFIKFKKDYFIHKREDRGSALMFTIFCYVINAIILGMNKPIGLTSQVLFYNIALIVGLGIIYFITLRFKISLHASGIGSAFWFYPFFIQGIFSTQSTNLRIAVLTTFYVLSTIVLFQRVWSKSHTTWQVISGTLLGVVVSAGVYYVCNMI